jgi:hypothetical protein
MTLNQNEFFRLSDHLYILVIPQVKRFYACNFTVRTLEFLRSIFSLWSLSQLSSNVPH